MKKLVLTILAIVFSVTIASASSTQEVLTLFNKYVNDANTYKPTIITMYSPNAKIIRQVVKPDGTTANATTNMSVYAKQMRISQGTAKIRNYKNYYNLLLTSMGLTFFYIGVYLSIEFSYTLCKR